MVFWGVSLKATKQNFSSVPFQSRSGIARAGKVESSFPEPLSENMQAENDYRAIPLLPRYLAIAYLALIVYASLHPFSGWRDTGISPFVFLEAAWPRYWTLFDLLINVAAYVPLGLLLAQSFECRASRLRAALLAFAAGVALSFAMESIQGYLPSRVPSNIDLLCNSLGAGLGAILSFCCGKRFFNRVSYTQQHLLTPVPHADYGLLLTGLWLLTQLSPETFLFGAGDLRHLFDIPPTLPYGAPSFFALETGITVCNTLAIGLIVSLFFAGRLAAPRALARFFAAALLIRTLAAAVLIGPQSALAWLTPGAGVGILVGGGALLLALLLPGPMRIAVAAMALMAGTVLVNLVPFNPYSVAALAIWRQGHFLNFNGLTRLIASFWPFLALPYLILLGRVSDSRTRKE
ncbi:teicoplanin resistance protein VanZ [Betaproteobacteria bacterium]|nr:teicoplanin resistance protein VanZ [Betaproteobacteria bacterium]